MLVVDDYSDSIVDCFDYIESIEILNDGKISEFNHRNKYFAKTVTNLKNIFKTARLMPAFGVSIHEEINKALKTGEWIKINFNRDLSKNDLPFTALVFQLTTVQGMNLIREYNGKYDGRCLYVDFDCEIDLYKELF